MEGRNLGFPHNPNKMDEKVVTNREAWEDIIGAGFFVLFTIVICIPLLCLIAVTILTGYCARKVRIIIRTLLGRRQLGKGGK